MIYEIEEHMFNFSEKNNYFVFRHSEEIDENGDFVKYNWIARRLPKIEAEKLVKDLNDGIYSEIEIEEMIENVNKEIE